MKNFRDRMFLLFSVISVISLFMYITSQCNPSAKEATEDEALAEEEIAEAEETMAEEVWLIDKHQINSVPLTSKAATVNSIKKAKEIHPSTFLPGYR